MSIPNCSSTGLQQATHWTLSGQNEEQLEEKLNERDVANTKDLAQQHLLLKETVQSEGTQTTGYKQSKSLKRPRSQFIDLTLPATSSTQQTLSSLMTIM